MKKIHISLFSAIVLVIILAALYGNLTGKNDPLFDQGTKTTFYAETEVGKEPDIRAENYFSEEEYDLSKFTFDLRVVSLEVMGAAGRIPETKAGMNEDTAITN